MEKKLTKYIEKRNFNKTKEPKGKIEKNSKNLHFCIQHHAARKDHYDLRLEEDGVLISFAVPKGPSYNPSDKRLAIHVEDHPISYRNFEGIIPQGEYGGGTVMLWDLGFWRPLEGSIKKGHLKFLLEGSRMRGKWALIKLQNNNWLLKKEKDNIKLYDDINFYNTSIKTGRTMAEITENKNPKKVEEKYIIEGVNITSPNKVIFKKPKITKLDIVLYYESIAHLMLPLIENRLISVIRAPQGESGSKFFKKHLETKNPGLGKKEISNSKNNKEDYYYIKDIRGLIAEVNMNSYEFHIWGSKLPHINNPDLMVFDLDPDSKLSLKKVREGVKDLKSILDEFGLESNLKTSGGKGYHVSVIFNNKITWKEFKKISENIASLMATKWENKYTSNMSKKKREGKIFIDYLRNAKGATSVAPYSLRIRKNAPISYPISWEELDTTKPNGITILNILNKIN